MAHSGVFLKLYIMKYLGHFCPQQILTICIGTLTAVSLTLLFAGQFAELIKKIVKL